jgi:hypothetical protein
MYCNGHNEYGQANSWSQGGITDIMVGETYTCIYGGTSTGNKVLCRGAIRYYNYMDMVSPILGTAIYDYQPSRGIVSGFQQLYFWGGDSIYMLGDQNTNLRGLAWYYSNTPEDIYPGVNPGSHNLPCTKLGEVQAYEEKFCHSCTNYDDLGIAGTALFCYDLTATANTGNASDIYQPINGQHDPIVSYGVGWEHRCFISVQGVMECYGRPNLGNFWGQLGYYDQSMTWVPWVDVPKKFPGWLIVRSGAYHSCAICFNGMVYCWGKLNGIRVFTPQQISYIPPFYAFELTLGQDYTCIKLTDGKIDCFGNNDRGQIGVQIGASKPSVTYYQNPDSIWRVKCLGNGGGGLYGSWQGVWKACVAKYGLTSASSGYATRVVPLMASPIASLIAEYHAIAPKLYNARGQYIGTTLGVLSRNESMQAPFGGCGTGTNAMWTHMNPSGTFAYAPGSNDGCAFMSSSSSQYDGMLWDTTTSGGVYPTYWSSCSGNFDYMCLVEIQGNLPV